MTYFGPTLSGANQYCRPSVCKVINRETTKEKQEKHSLCWHLTNTGPAFILK